MIEDAGLVYPFSIAELMALKLPRLERLAARARARLGLDGG